MAAAMLLCLGASAQNDYRQMEQQAGKRVRAKAEKVARKQAKQDMKAGWTVAPGVLPIAKQYDNYYKMLYMQEQDGRPYYITGDAMSVGSTYDAAKLTAATLAKTDLAGKIQSEVANLIEASVANEQLSQEEAVSLSRVVSESKNLISAKLIALRQPIDVYRKTATGAIEVRVVYTYSQKEAREAAKAAIKEDLEKRGEELRADLDRLLGLEED